MRKCIFLVFVLFTCLIIKGQTIDLRILKAINKNEHPAWDKTMRLTSHSVYPAMILVPGSLYMSGYLNDDKIRMRNGARAGVSLGLNLLLTTGLKYAINRPRPFAKYPDDITRRVNASHFSFPSGHTSTAFAMATALTLSEKKWYVAVPSYLYACGVAYSRMRLGVHFPSDILGGIVIGIGSTLLVWQADKWIQRRQ